MRRVLGVRWQQVNGYCVSRPTSLSRGLSGLSYCNTVLGSEYYSLWLGMSAPILAGDSCSGHGQ